MSGRERERGEREREREATSTNTGLCPECVIKSRGDGVGLVESARLLYHST